MSGIQSAPIVYRVTMDVVTNLDALCIRRQGLFLITIIFLINFIHVYCLPSNPVLHLNFLLNCFTPKKCFLSFPVELLADKPSLLYSTST